MKRITSRVLPYVALLSILWGAVFVMAGNVQAHHDNHLTDRAGMLAACLPAWDPGDPDITTLGGLTLHDEPFEVRDLFYTVWGDDDLDTGQHLRRWRWEYDCTHPDAVPVSAPVAPPPHPVPPWPPPVQQDLTHPRQSWTPGLIRPPPHH